MAEGTSTKTGKPGKPKEAAAVEEVQDNVVRTITVRGKEFKLPDQQPSELLFAARVVSKAARTQNEAGAVEGMVDMAVAYIGEDGLLELMAGKTLEDGVSILEEVLEKASEQYGSEVGESAASAKS